ncbi:IS3 family transposase [Myxococcota bacterium]|nr:IS3 family transposase [Myxococcota bacterium]
MILALVDEATAAGARLSPVCERFGISPRTVERWRRCPDVGDLRCGPRTEPGNKLTAEERAAVLAVVNRPEFRDLPPSQIVPRLADRGEYIASEATMYRILKEKKQLKRRGRAAEPTKRRRPDEHVATRPNRVWSWDITYLKSPVHGRYYYLYLVMDVWSRKIVGIALHERECQELAAELIEQAARAERVASNTLVLHADNGGPMKGSTMLAKLQSLGVMPSFSRPSTSNDNPFSEALFRTLKYRPCYPDGAFSSLAAARRWVDEFVRWYNHEHLHSATNFTSPAVRHAGGDRAVLAKRQCVYEQAKNNHPERWGRRATRAWRHITTVHLNPTAETLVGMKGVQAA